MSKSGDAAPARLAILSAVAGQTLHPLAGFEGAFLRELSMADLDDIREEGDQRIRLIIVSVVDETGAPLFTDADADSLARLKVPAFNAITEQINRVNGFGDASAESAAKN